jgi:hypothetical protein
MPHIWECYISLNLPVIETRESYRTIQNTVLFPTTSASCVTARDGLSLKVDPFTVLTGH